MLSKGQVVGLILSSLHPKSNNMASHDEGRSFNHCNSKNTNKPPWLLSTIADLDDRIKTLPSKTAEEEEENGGDTFAKRAEFYYQTRPQLLSLVQDLYNAYTTLSNRYIQTLPKNNHYYPHISAVEELDNGTSQMDSDDAESSLSYQTQSSPMMQANYIDTLLAEIVIKNVEHDLLSNEISIMERQCGDSSRKIELHKSLLDVLESERLILLNENARLGYRVNALLEINKGLEAELVFMKRKVGEMARCMVKMRDDHRVYVLSRKIENLEGQVYGLEKRNREYYEELVKKDEVIMQEKKSSGRKNVVDNGNGVGSDVCFQFGKIKVRRNDSVGKKGSKWWERVKSMDLFSCGVHGPTSSN